MRGTLEEDLNVYLVFEDIHGLCLARSTLSVLNRERTVIRVCLVPRGGLKVSKISLDD